MLQPNDKVHHYNIDDLCQYIKDYYERSLKLSNKMDELLDFTTHLPNFRQKCRMFITMGKEIDELTMVALNNLKATKKIKE